MAIRQASLHAQLANIELTARKLLTSGGRRAAPAIERFTAGAAAARFHLTRTTNGPILLAILGGTGTGKSTLLNRLLDADIAGVSFRRTFTAGPIAVVCDLSRIPPLWLGIEHSIVDASQLPARGQADVLTVVIASADLLNGIALIDTPDLDGDQPAHHAQADRVFRWADAALFLVTPEKYQMTELLPYYRLARRYALPMLFVMNKAEDCLAAADYARQVEAPMVFVIPRDDAAFEPPAQNNLNSLRQAIATMSLNEDAARSKGNRLRVGDLIDRLRDQIVDPLRAERHSVDQMVRSVRALEAPDPGIDTSPLVQQLQRRLQQKSVLYLMGPGRVLQRVRQVPGMLAQLPRTTWDLLRTGRLSAGPANESAPDAWTDRPDFRTALIDQFRALHSRIDDTLRSSMAIAGWIDAADDYAATKLDTDLAAQIADDELVGLRQWLEQHWTATPRDTALIERLLKRLPGGAKLAKWSEAAPYLLAIVVATHHAFFGPIDLLILGGWTLATWLGERLSNEVSARARAANRAIASRFEELAHRQIERTCQWLQNQAPPSHYLDELKRQADEICESVR